jgi:glycerol kinase
VRFLLSLDEGTTSARAALYDECGRRIGLEGCAVPSFYPRAGWVEQDAEEIWRLQLQAVHLVLERAGIGARWIAALGITNQRETTIVWERKSGRPVAQAIVWQCRRTAGACAELARSALASTITQKTGLVIDAYFSASKIQWILEHVPDARRKARDGELLFGTVDTWLIWKLTNGAVHVTDHSNASRTMLMDLAAGEWDAGLLDVFGVPREMLPTIVASSSVVGVTAGEHLGAEIPIAGIAGDQQAALFGQGCFRSGLAKNTYGTGCFALITLDSSGRFQRISCWRRGRHRLMERGSRWKARCSSRGRRSNGFATSFESSVTRRRAGDWRSRLPIPVGSILCRHSLVWVRHIGTRMREG